MSSHFRSPSGRRPFRPFRPFRSNRGYRGRGVGRGGTNIRENFDNNHYSDKFDSRYKNYKIHRGSWYGKDRIVLSPDGHSLSSRHSRDRFSDNRSHDYSFHRKYREDSSSHRSRGSSYHVHPKERERFGFRSENDFRRKPENLREYSEYDSELITSSYASGPLSRGIRRKPRGVGLRRITTTNHILMRKNYLRTERNKKLSVLALRKMKMIKMLRMKNAARGLYGKRQSSKASDKSVESTRNSPEIEDRARNDVNERKSESLNKSQENDGEKENDKKSGEKEKEKNSKDVKKMKKAKHENEMNNSEEVEEDKEVKTDEDRETSDDKVSNPKMNTNMFIELRCPHCKKSYRTFMQYRNHLQSFQHKLVMVKLVHMLKRKLGLLRFDQRKAQQTIDKHADSQRVFFCDLCKLRYKQSKADHNMSYFHLTITEFLLPRCKLCKINFQTPIGYEHHRCSLLHIKRKAAFKDGVKSKREAVEEEVEEETDEFNEPFILVDQVESGDESDSPDVRNDGDEEHIVKIEDVKPVKEKIDKTDESHTDKEELGINFMRIVKTAYCDLCGTCVPYQQNKSVRSLMRSHCRRSVHIKSYNRYKEEQKSSDKTDEESKQTANELEEVQEEDKMMTVEAGETSADERYKYSDDEGDIVKKRFDRLHSTNEG